MLESISAVNNECWAGFRLQLLGTLTGAATIPLRDQLATTRQSKGGSRKGSRGARSQTLSRTCAHGLS